jgi:hypothetical protein
MQNRITALVPGTAIDIPVETAFQYHNVSDVELKFICSAMPPWPGESEASFIEGKWQPTVESCPIFGTTDQKIRYVLQNRMS